MKKKTLSLNYISSAILFFIVSIMLFSCDDSDESAVTPPTDVIYSDWITNVWTRQDNGFVVHNIEASPITQTVLDQDVVLVYFKQSAEADFIKVLPSNYYVNAQLVFTLEFSASAGQLTVFHGASKANDEKGIDSFRPNSQTRYIIIPGNKEVTEGRVKQKVDYNNYEEVCSYYAIKP